MAKAEHADGLRAQKGRHTPHARARTHTPTATPPFGASTRTRTVSVVDGGVGVLVCCPAGPTSLSDFVLVKRTYSPTGTHTPLTILPNRP